MDRRLMQRARRAHPLLDRARMRAQRARHASAAPLERPAWDDTTHDLTKLALRPEEVLQRKLAALSPHDPLAARSLHRKLGLADDLQLQLTEANGRVNLSFARAPTAVADVGDDSILLDQSTYTSGTPAKSTSAGLQWLSAVRSMPVRSASPRGRQVHTSLPPATDAMLTTPPAQATQSAATTSSQRDAAVGSPLPAARAAKLPRHDAHPPSDSITVAADASVPPVMMTPPPRAPIALAALPVRHAMLTSPALFVDSFMAAYRRHKRGRHAEEAVVEDESSALNESGGTYTRYGRAAATSPQSPPPNTQGNTSFLGAQSVITAAASVVSHTNTVATTRAPVLHGVHVPPRLAAAWRVRGDAASDPRSPAVAAAAAPASRETAHTSRASDPQGPMRSTVSRASEESVVLEEDSVPPLPPRTTSWSDATLEQIVQRYEARVRALTGNDPQFDAILRDSIDVGAQAHADDVELVSTRAEAAAPSASTRRPLTAVVQHEPVLTLQPLPATATADPMWLSEALLPPAPGMRAAAAAVAEPAPPSSRSRNVSDAAHVSNSDAEADAINETFHHMAPLLRSTLEPPSEVVTSYAYVPQPRVQHDDARAHVLRLSSGMTPAAFASVAGRAQPAVMSSPPAAQRLPAATTPTYTAASIMQETLAFVTPTGTPTRKAEAMRAAAAAAPLPAGTGGSKLRWFGAPPVAAAPPPPDALTHAPSEAETAAATVAARNPMRTRAFPQPAWHPPAAQGAAPEAEESLSRALAPALDEVAVPRTFQHVRRVLQFESDGTGGMYEPTPLPRGFGSLRRAVPEPTSK